MFAPAEPEAAIAAVEVDELRELISVEIVADERQRQLLGLIDGLVELYDTTKQLPADAEKAALIKELWGRRKKRRIPLVGEAPQVQVIDGVVTLPLIPLPTIETVPEDSLISLGTQPVAGAPLLVSAENGSESS